MCELEAEANEINAKISSLPPETTETVGVIGNEDRRNNQS